MDCKRRMKQHACNVFLPGAEHCVEHHEINTSKHGASFQFSLFSPDFLQVTKFETNSHSRGVCLTLAPLAGR